MFQNLSPVNHCDCAAPIRSPRSWENGFFKNRGSSCKCSLSLLPQLSRGQFAENRFEALLSNRNACYAGYSLLYFPLFISVMGACLLRGMRAHGWVFRFCQLLVQSISELAANSGSSRMSQAPNLHLQCSNKVVNCCCFQIKLAMMLQYVLNGELTMFFTFFVGYQI